MEAWDEPTSLKPTGVHPATSPYREGRAATVGLTARADPAPLALTPGDLDRLGQLAVCAGLEHVQERAGQAAVEVGVEEDGHHITRAQLGAEEADTRSQFWDLLTNTGEQADVGLQDRVTQTERSFLTPCQRPRLGHEQGKRGT